jgi:hypothetical protein
MRFFAVFALFLGACASPPPLPDRPAFPGKAAALDGAERLQLYERYRLVPAASGRAYGYAGVELPKSRLGDFLDAQGDTVGAQWARRGNAFIAAGWVLAALLEGGAVALAAQTPEGQAARNAWWLALAPSALLGWSFHGFGDGWFRRPAAARYN